MGRLLGCGAAMLMLLPCIARAEDDLRQFVERPFERYHHAEPAFSIRFPYRWMERPPSLPGQVFEAAAKLRVPQLRIFVLERPEGLPLDATARAAAGRLGAELKRSELDRLPDGTEVCTAEVETLLPLGLGVPIRSLWVSAFTDTHWILVSLTDGRPKGPFPAELRDVAYSLTLGSE